MKKLLPWIWVPCLVACGDPTESTPTPAPEGVPLTGGTMIVTGDGRQAVISDPDRDRVVSVDLARDQVVGDIRLLAGDEPGRIIEDGAGRVHVALRRGGAVVTLDGPNHDHLVARRVICPEPRGLAWQASTDTVHVACSTGELVSLPAAGGGVTRRLRLDRDLRDVVVVGDELRVSRFKTAELLSIDAGGAVVARQKSPNVRRFAGFGPMGPPPGDGFVNAVPAVAWRTIGTPDGGVLMLHQRQSQGVLDTSPGGYSDMCQGPVETAVSTFLPGEEPFAVRPDFFGAVTVDVAMSPDGDLFAMAMSGVSGTTVVPTTNLKLADSDDGCRGGIPDNARVPPLGDEMGAPTAVAYAPSGDLATYYPDLPALVVRHGDSERVIDLTGQPIDNPGRRLFHRQTESGLACASCHPEGREDGLVWTFATLGARRTQTVAGHVLARAPYHWDGDQADLETLMRNVFTGRMSGGELSGAEMAALGPWLDRIPAPAAAPRNEASAARGKNLFESEAVGCATCHTGAVMTDNRRVSVGTGGVNVMFKVPSLLGVGGRAPFMHDGCAATLADRFGPCGGGDLHGRTSQLSAAQLADLISYLETL